MSSGFPALSDPAHPGIIGLRMRMTVGDRGPLGGEGEFWEVIQMKCSIRYAVNGKEYEEEIIDLTIFNKVGDRILYAYSTMEGTDEHGVCVVRPGYPLPLFVVYPIDDKISKEPKIP